MTLIDEEDYGLDDAELQTIEDVVLRDLSHLEKSYYAGFKPALFEAIELCEAWSIEWPSWLKVEAGKEAKARMMGAPARTRGRTGNPVAYSRQILKDFIRYDEVREIRRQQKLIAQQVEDLKRGPAHVKGLLREQEKMLKAIGRTYDDAVTCAARLLSFGFAAGEFETILASCKRVERASKDPKTAALYKYPSDQTLKELGLFAECKGAVPEGSKFLELLLSV